MSRPSAHEKENYLREQMDDDEIKKIGKKYPNTKWADMGAFLLIDNKLCGDWQGSTKCPERIFNLREVRRGASRVSKQRKRCTQPSIDNA